MACGRIVMSHRDRSLRRGLGVGGGMQNLRLPQLHSEAGDAASPLATDVSGMLGRSRLGAQAPERERKQRLELLKQNRRRRHGDRAFDESENLHCDWADQECRLKWERLRRERAAEKSNLRAAQMATMTVPVVAEAGDPEQSRNLAAPKALEKLSKGVADKATAVLSTLDEPTSLGGRALPPLQTPRLREPRLLAVSPPRSGLDGRLAVGAVNSLSASAAQPTLSRAPSVDEDDADEPLCRTQPKFATMALEHSTSQGMLSTDQSMWTESPEDFIVNEKEPRARSGPEPPCLAVAVVTNAPLPQPPQPSVSSPPAPVLEGQPWQDTTLPQPNCRIEEHYLVQSAALQRKPPEEQFRPCSAGSEPIIVVTVDDDDSIVDDFDLEEVEVRPENIVGRLMAEATEEVMVAAAARCDAEESADASRLCSRLQLALEGSLENGTLKSMLTKYTRNIGMATSGQFQQQYSGVSNCSRKHHRNLTWEMTDDGQFQRQFSGLSECSSKQNRNQTRKRTDERLRKALTKPLDEPFDEGSLVNTLTELQIKNHNACEKIRNGLEQAVADGTLKHKLEELTKQNVHEKMRTVLEENLEDGTLKLIVDEVRNTKVREKFRLALDRKLEDGTLEKNMKEIIQCTRSVC